MAEGANGNGSKIKVPVTVALGLLLTILTSVISGMAAVYAMRDSITKDLTVRSEQNKQEILAAVRENLTHYVSTEVWLQWRQQERERSDSQFYGIMAAIAKLDRSTKK